MSRSGSAATKLPQSQTDGAGKTTLLRASPAVAIVTAVIWGSADAPSTGKTDDVRASLGIAPSRKASAAGLPADEENLLMGASALQPLNVVGEAERLCDLAVYLSINFRVCAKE